MVGYKHYIKLKLTPYYAICLEEQKECELVYEGLFFLCATADKPLPCGAVRASQHTNWYKRVECWELDKSLASDWYGQSLC